MPSSFSALVAAVALGGSVVAASVPTYVPPAPGVLNASDFLSWITAQAASGAPALALEPGT
jgi:hypothetical protein